MTQPAAGRRRRRRVSAEDVRFALWSLVSTAAGLGLAIGILPGASVDSLWSLLAAVVAVGLGDILARPLLRRLAVRLGAAGALFLGVGAQLVVAWLALSFIPGVRIDSWSDVAAVLIVAGILMAAGRWVTGARDNDYVLGDLLRRASRTARRRLDAGQAPPAGGHPAGILLIQLDGLGRQTLDYALQAGHVPTLARWLAGGSHRLETWWARVPATTPASLAGLLHGTSDQVPAFRWWDRGDGRLMVASRPADAAVIEARISDGAGLLAEGGVAISSMFSGDAPTSLLVMSRARSGLGPGEMFVRFFASPFVLVRALVTTVAEFVKELFQGWQQVARGVEPRVSRFGAYPALRAVSNVILRDLNTTLVAEQMLRGAPAIFVDLVDYDEIAHHAGPLRPEALRALEGLDRVVGLWERVAAGAPREYRIVVLSDHGQSLGSTFAQVAGVTLADEVRRLMALPTEPEGMRRGDRGDRGEVWGSLNTALNAFARSGVARTIVGPDSGSAAESAGTAGAPPAAVPEVVVTGSGNLAMIWFPGAAERLDEADIRVRWPALVPGLLGNPAIGLVLARADDAVVVRGRAGAHELRSGRVEGADPLAAYGPRAAADLLRLADLADSGDLVLISTVDEVGMVHAFEGLVGSHGGLGGAQNEAVLIHPVDLDIPARAREPVGSTQMLVGAETVHRCLTGWLAALGLRSASDAGRAAGGATAP